jgi:hypothetical protein
MYIVYISRPRIATDLHVSRLALTNLSSVCTQARCLLLLLSLSFGLHRTRTWRLVSPQHPHHIVQVGQRLAKRYTVAGLHQMTCISGLTHCYHGGLDDAPGNTVHTHAVNKCKAPPSNDQDNCQHVACKIKAALDCDASTDGTTTELAMEPAEDDYKSIKAMADTDHLVCMPLPSFLKLIINSGCGLQTPGRAYC